MYLLINVFKQVEKYCRLEFESSSLDKVIFDVTTAVNIMTAALAFFMSLVIDTSHFVYFLILISIVTLQ